MVELTILDGHGDTTLTWDHTDLEAREEIRRTVADLKAKGYIFFLVDGTPADEITAGAGALIVRRLTADQVVDVEPVQDVKPQAASQEQPKHRGRPRKNVIATRPVSGG